MLCCWSINVTRRRDKCWIRYTYYQPQARFMRCYNNSVCPWNLRAWQLLPPTLRGVILSTLSAQMCSRPIGLCLLPTLLGLYEPQAIGLNACSMRAHGYNLQVNKPVIKIYTATTFSWLFRSKMFLATHFLTTFVTCDETCAQLQTRFI